jgi:hypothetical protein
MGILRWSLGAQGRFVVTNTVFWTTAAAAVLFGRKVLTGEFGSPDFIAVMLITPIGVFSASIVMWNLLFKSNPFAKAKRE